MTIKSWTEEFYPIKADDISIIKNPVAAIKHCIKKWEGLRPESLERHAVEKREGADIQDVKDENDIFDINSDTCALCARNVVMGCDSCELAGARGGINCCDNTTKDEKMSPYDAWMQKSDPEPMIFWLKKTLENHQ